MWFLAGRCYLRIKDIWLWLHRFLPLLSLCMHAKSLQSSLTATLWTVVHQAPLSIGFPRQEYWRGLPSPSSGDFPDPGIETASLSEIPCMAGRLFTTSATWHALLSLYQLVGSLNLWQVRVCRGVILSRLVIVPRHSMCIEGRVGW